MMDNKLLAKFNRKNRIQKCSIIVFIWGVLVYFLHTYMSDSSFMRFCTLSALFVFVIELCFIASSTKELFHPSIIFLLAYYAFQSGQLLLLALNISFNTYYIDTLRHLLPDVTLFSAISNVLAGYAGVIFVKGYNEQRKKISFVENYSSSSISNAAFIGCCATAIVAIPLVLIKFFGYALPSGYWAVRDFETGIPSIIVLIEYMYVPFTILYLVFSSRKNDKLLVKIVFCIWSVFTALCGDRTTGIAGIMAMVLCDYLLIEDTNKKKRIALKIVFIGILCMILIKVAFTFRIKGNWSSVFESGLITEFLSELGGSVFPLFTMMEVVPANEPFLHGMQYVQAFISGFIPSTLDVFGVIKSITPLDGIYQEWITQYFPQYNFGLGFSLNAEAYINFGWFGEIAIFFLVGIVMYNLTNNYVNTGNSNKFGIYKMVVLLFVWFTLPRRNSYYIWNGIFWCVFMVSVYLKILCVPKRQIISNRAPYSYTKSA